MNRPASVVRSVRRSSLIAILALAPHGEAQLRHAADSDRENDDGARKERGEKRDRERHLPVHAKKLNAYVAGVLSDEVDQSHPHDDRYRGGEPRGGRAGVAERFAFVARRRGRSNLAARVVRGGRNRGSIAARRVTPIWSELAHSRPPHLVDPTRSMAVW